MQQLTKSFTEPEIVTTEELKHRSYVTFYYDEIRQREYHAKSIGLNINPNRAKTIEEKYLLLKKLKFAIHKALDDGKYCPAVDNSNFSTSEAKGAEALLLPAINHLFNAIKLKVRSGLSRTYKRDLKSIYRQFRDYMTPYEKSGMITDISVARIEQFLSQFNKSGTYYMNKRRNLSVLFSAATSGWTAPVKSVKATSKRKVKAKLHDKYDKGQLLPILDYLKTNYPNLHLCCLMTYACWLRPHEEIRLLTAGDFKKDYTEIHLSGTENKGGKVRVVYVPDYVRDVLQEVLTKLHRTNNIFTKSTVPFNYSYFNTQWSRAYEKMYFEGLVFDNQTIYSFRHTAAVDLYRKTKDVYLLQKLLGHSSIVVTLKYLRSLGELNSEELKAAAPQLY